MKPSIDAATAPPSARTDLGVARWLAAWAPDAARERLIALLEAAAGDDAVLAEASEVLGKVFAVTGAWSLAARAYHQAAATWAELGQVALAASLRELADRFPLAPFADDQEALTAELAVLDAAQRGVTAGDRLVELRRALPPRPITGWLEASFALAPEEMRLVMAAVASILDAASYPARTTAGWSTVLTGGPGLDDGRLLASGLCRATPMLCPYPGLVSRLLGRDRLEQPQGVRLEMVSPGVAPSGAPDAIAALVGPSIGVIHGGGARGAAAAAIAAGQGWNAIAAHAVLGAAPASLTAAALEARLFRGLIAVDLDAWRELGVELVGGDGGAALALRGPLFALAADDPAIAARHRAFTIQLAPDAVSSRP